jgi:hypothetical protein
LKGNNSTDHKLKLFRYIEKALRRLRHKDSEFKASLDYMARPCFGKSKQNKMVKREKKYKSSIEHN